MRTVGSVARGRTMRIKAFWIAVFLASLLGVGPPDVAAATNRVFGGIGGINNGTITGGDGTGAAEITINSAPLALVKQARDLSGNVIPDGANVASATRIYFVLYVDNPTDAAAFDVRMLDQLDENWFLYQPGSLATTEVPSGSSDAQVWSGTWTPLLDPQDGDVCSALDNSGVAPGPDRISCGLEGAQPNPRMPVPAGTLKAIRFQVEVR